MDNLRKEKQWLRILTGSISLSDGGLQSWLAYSAWLGKQAHTQVKRVDELELALSKLEAVPARLDNHIEETRKGFAEGREHIDVVMTSIKDDIRTLTTAVLERK